MMNRLLPWILPFTFLVVWFLSGELGYLSDSRIPTPVAVIQAAWRLAQSGELWRHLVASTCRAFSGFALGGFVGLALGVCTGTNRFMDRLLDTSLQMVRTIPHLAMIPLVILWLGVGEAAKIFLVALGVLFPMYLNTHHGFRTVDPSLIEMGRVYGLSRWGLFRYILLPSALPSVLVGVRYALGVMWLTLIVAETIAATSGIGFLAMTAREFLRTEVVLLTILLYAILGKFADLAARLLERILLPWHPAFATKSDGGNR